MPPRKLRPGTAVPAAPELRTLAEKLDWLIENVHPADRNPYSNAELAALVEKATGEKVSDGAIWRLRTGRVVNPTKRIIEALAKTLGAPPSFFFDEYDEQARQFADQVELLTLIRDSGVDRAQLRSFLSLSPEGRQAIASIILHTARAEAEREKDRKAGD